MVIRPKKVTRMTYHLGPLWCLSLMWLMLAIFQTPEAMADAPRPLEPGEGIEDTLTADAPRNFNDGSYYHLYRVGLEVDQVARFDITGEPNSYLSLFAPNGELLRHEKNDQSETAQYSYHGQLSYKIEESGSYLLAVGSNSSRALGRYHVSLKTIELETVDPLVPGAAIKGWLQGFKTTHTLRIDTIGQYRIRFGSDDFSTYLMVDQGSHYKSIDSGDDTNEKLDVFFRAPGDYELIIRDSDDRWRNGFYTLEVEALACCQIKTP